MSGAKITGSTNIACYKCIVNATSTFSTQDIIAGSELQDGTDTYKLSNSENYRNVRKAYLTALARCRYDLYKISGYFNASN